MKKLSLFLLMILLISCAVQQEPVDTRLHKLHYQNSGGEKGVTIHLYDESGRNYKAFWTLLEGSRFSFNYHHYDESGNFVRKYREFSDGLTSENRYRYDEAGNKVWEDFKRSDGVGGEAKYSYDTGGRRISADCDGLNGWFNGDIVYEYDDSGRKDGGTILKDGREIGRIVCTYNEAGKLLTEYWEMGQWNQTFAYEYENVPKAQPDSYVSSNVFIFNTENHRLVNENYNYSNESGGPSFFEYDENGKLLKKIFERSDGLRTETSFEFDDKGLLVSSTRNHHDGLATRFKYNFNTDRRLVSRIMERSDGVKGKEWYEYDASGKLVSARYDNFDYWLNGTISFEYDGSDLARGIFTGEDGFNADITFDTGESGNPDRIHWKFSFGKTQTYTFKYETIK